MPVPKRSSEEIQSTLTHLGNGLLKKSFPPLTQLRKFLLRLLRHETLAVPALAVSVFALALAMIPALSAPLVHLIALIAMILGATAWERGDSKLLCSAVIAIAGLALAWRYMLLLLLLLIGAVWYSLWRDKRRRARAEMSRARPPN